MAYGPIRRCRGAGKKGYGLDRTLGTFSINNQPDDYTLFGLDRDQADNRVGHLLVYVVDDLHM